jgi:hypothetical protein
MSRFEQRAVEVDMAAASKILVPWLEAFGSDSFMVLCCHSPNGEQFIVLPADRGKKTAVDAMGLPVGAFLSETDLRRRLTQAGLSEQEATSRIELAREWATTVSRSGARRLDG